MQPSHAGDCLETIVTRCFLNRHSRESGNPGPQGVRLPLDSRFRGSDEQNVLALPGSMFGPGQEAYLRLAFANAEAAVMPALAQRLAADAARG